MPSWIALSRDVFTRRYEKTSSWYGSAVAEDTYATNIVVQARVAHLTYPGSVRAADGNFLIDDSVAPAGNGGMRVTTVYQGFTWRLIPFDLGAEAIQPTKGTYTDANAWFRKDWTIADLQAAGVKPEYLAFVRNARAMWDKALKMLDWIPTEVSTKVAQVMDMGVLPIMASVQQMQQAAGFGLPTWLNTDARKAAWEAIRLQFRDLLREVNSTTLAAVKNAAAVADANADFWNNVAKWSGVDAVMGAFAKIREAIGLFNQNKRQAEDSITRMNALVAATPGAFSAADKARLVGVNQEVVEITSKAKAAIDGPVLSALRDDGTTINGLGIAPVIVIGIGAAVVASAAAALAIYVREMEVTRRKAMDLEAEFIKTREQADNAVFQQTQQLVVERRKQLYAMLDAGKIDKAEFDKQVKILESEAANAANMLTSRREQTATQARDFGDSLRKAPENTLEGPLAQFKWIAIVGVAGLALWYLGPAIGKMLNKRASAAPAPAPAPSPAPAPAPATVG